MHRALVPAMVLQQFQQVEETEVLLIVGRQLEEVQPLPPILQREIT
jgi:hypothetical protein